MPTTLSWNLGSSWIFHPMWAIPCYWPHLYCPPSPEAEQRISKFSVVPTHVSECHSQCLDPILRGWTERFVGGRTFWVLWGQIVTKWKRFWVESLLCRMVRVELSQCLNGGWTDDQSSPRLCPNACNILERLIPLSKLNNSRRTFPLKLYLKKPSVLQF